MARWDDDAGARIEELLDDRIEEIGAPINRKPVKQDPLPPIQFPPPLFPIAPPPSGLPPVESPPGSTAPGETPAPPDTYVTWVAVDDERTCPFCLGNSMAGVRRYGEPFPSGDIEPPIHLNCRCYLLDTGGSGIIAPRM